MGHAGAGGGEHNKALTRGQRGFVRKVLSRHRTTSFEAAGREAGGKSEDRVETYGHLNSGQP